MMVSWKEEYDNEEVQKLKPNGDSFSECCRYLTTFREERKLVGKTFTFQSLNQKESISFVLRNDRWESEGQISQETRSSWLKPL